MSENAPLTLLRRRPWLGAVLIVLAAWLVYANSLGGAFVFDDDHAVVENEQIRDLWPITQHVLHGRRGVVSLTFAINYAIHELDPVGFHAGNVIIHCLVGLTLFGLVRQTLLLAPASAEVRRRLDQNATLLALIVAVLWVVHPLNTMAVTYVVQRMESLMGLFYLLTLYCLAKSSRSPRRWLWWAGAVAACATGMNSKEVMFTAPLVAIIYDRTFLSESWKALLKQRGLLHLLLLSTWLVLLADNPVNTLTQEGASAGFESPVFTPWTYLMAQAEVLLVYLYLSVFPLTLTVDWGWPPFQGFTVRNVAALLLVGSLVLASFYGFYRRSWLGFVGLFFFFVLSITSSVIPIADLMMEHRMYLPLGAVLSLIVIGGYLLLIRTEASQPERARKLRPLASALILLAVLALGTRTVARNFDYQSRVRLWEAAVEARPYQGRAWHNLGEALQRVGRDDESMAAYERSIELIPTFTDAYNNLAIMYMERGQFDAADRLLRHALDVAPDDAAVVYNYGKLQMALGNLPAAAAQFRQTVELDPKYDAGWNNLGVTLAQLGQGKQAVAAFRQALALEPESVEYLVNLGTFLQRTGQRDEAVDIYQQAAALDPESALPHEHMGNIHAIEGRYQQAADSYEQAWQREPKPSVAMRLARVWVLADQPARAVATLRRWLEADTASPAPRQHLAWLLATHPDSAVRDPQTALRLAEQGMAIAGQPHPAMLLTFAAAQAAMGQFDAAVRSAQQAQDMLTQAGLTDQAQRVEQYIQQFQADQPIQTKGLPLGG